MGRTRRCYSERPQHDSWRVVRATTTTSMKSIIQQSGCLACCAWPCTSMHLASSKYMARCQSGHLIDPCNMIEFLTLPVCETNPCRVEFQRVLRDSLETSTSRLQRHVLREDEQFLLRSSCCQGKRAYSQMLDVAEMVPTPRRLAPTPFRWWRYGCALSSWLVHPIACPFVFHDRYCRPKLFSRSTLHCQHFLHGYGTLVLGKIVCVLVVDAVWWSSSSWWCWDAAPSHPSES